MLFKLLKLVRSWWLDGAFLFILTNGWILDLRQMPLETALAAWEDPSIQFWNSSSSNWSQIDHIWPAVM